MNAQLENGIIDTLELMKRNQELKKQVISSLYDLTKEFQEGNVDKIIKENLAIVQQTKKDEIFINSFKNFFDTDNASTVEPTESSTRFKLCDGWYGELITNATGALHTFDILKNIGEKGKPLLRHKHEYGNETIVIIKGEVEITVENKYFPFIKRTRTLKEGQSLIIKCNTYHSILPKTNTKLLSIFKPPIIE